MDLAAHIVRCVSESSVSLSMVDLNFRWPADYSDFEHPIVCQLGGNNPSTLSEVAKTVEQWGYDEINLNVGCPSSRVSTGCFGASLMKDPELVRDLVYSISRQVQIPVTVKTRIGVDNLHSPEFLKHFVQTVATGGCHHFITHARTAWLKGVNPKKNRTIPHLQYDRVFMLCQEFPHLKFSLNGGVKSLEQAHSLIFRNSGVVTPDSSSLPEERLQESSIESDRVPMLNGVMIGRATIDYPCSLANVDTMFYGAVSNPSSAFSRETLAKGYMDYLDEMFPECVESHSTFPLIKPILGLFTGESGTRMFRQILDQVIRTESHSLTPSEILHKGIVAVKEKFPHVLSAPLSGTSEISRRREEEKKEWAEHFR